MTLFICSICALIAIMVIAYLIVKYNNNDIETMSFRETMDLVGLPIVTFRNNNKRFNFLLDTGASTSVINKKVLSEMDYKNTNMGGTIFGMEGNQVDAPLVYIELTYKEKQYDDIFQCVDMTAAFDNVKQEYGVTIHGILSSHFFEKYKYILNFKDLIAYSKK